MYDNLSCYTYGLSYIGSANLLRRKKDDLSAAVLVSAEFSNGKREGTVVVQHAARTFLFLLGTRYIYLQY